MSNLGYPNGVDCVWIAPDSAGNVAAFVTAGVGPVPVVLIRSKSIPLEEIENKIMELPVISSANIIVNVPRPDDFIDLASRGFFVYDWRDAHRSIISSGGLYEIVATPNLPLKLKDVRGDFLTFLNQFKIDWLDYSKSPSVNIIDS